MGFFLLWSEVPTGSCVLWFKINCSRDIRGRSIRVCVIKTAVQIRKYLQYNHHHREARFGSVKRRPRFMFWPNTRGESCRIYEEREIPRALNVVVWTDSWLPCGTPAMLYLVLILMPFFILHLIYWHVTIGVHHHHWAILLAVKRSSNFFHSKRMNGTT